MANEKLLDVIREEVKWERLRPPEAANYVLKVHDVEHPPVLVNDIAYRLGVDVKDYLPNSREFAVARSDAVPPTIRLDRRLPPDHRRFALAHSLGHLVLHPLGQYINKSYSGDAKESEANEFAAHLLMPFWMFGPLLWGAPPPADSFSALFQMPCHIASVQIADFLDLPVRW